MKLQILVIRDIVSNCYPFAPMHVIHIGSAIRDFGDQCKDPTKPLGAHPSDYELYHNGEWDDTTNEYTLLEQPKQLAVGLNYKS